MVNWSFDLVDREIEWKLHVERIFKGLEDHRIVTRVVKFLVEKMPIPGKERIEPTFGRPLEVEDRTTGSLDMAIDCGEDVVPIR